MLHHRVLIGFLNMSLGNTFQKTSKIGHFFVYAIIIMIPNVKKMLSNVFSFGASLAMKQPPSLLNIYYRWKKN